MSLKRTVYHIAGKDYESGDKITFTFFVQRVSINNFLNLNYSTSAIGATIRKCKPTIGDFTIDHQHTNVDAAVRPIIVTCTAAGLFLMLKKIGLNEWSSIETLSMWVRNRELRAKQTVKHERYNCIHVFDPASKRSWLTSNSPKKIQGRQAVINGKLWRKYITVERPHNTTVLD